MNFELPFNISTKMPTLGSQPSLKSTQAVGAVLLHQFARQRFLEAGLDEDIIREAENLEDLDILTSELLNESTTSTSINNTSASHSVNGCKANGHADSSTRTDTTNDTTASTIVLNNSTASTTVLNNSTTSTSVHNNSAASSHDSTTLENNNNSTGLGAEHFHSMAETSTASSNNPADHTMYHSMHTGNNVTSTLDKLQSSTLMAGYGRELRRIADEFEKTRERQIIKERANQVQLSDINKESFFELMSELFEGGITGERIVMLFLFSTDVALRAACQAQDLVVKLLSWSFSFIIDIVCKVVHELGGWDNLLCRQLPYVLMLCFLALGTCAFAVYLKRALRA